MGDDTPPERPPPPPPPKRLSRPKITIQIPDSPKIVTSPKSPRNTPGVAPIYLIPPGFQGKVPGTAGTHLSDPHGNPYFNPFMHVYHSKATDMLFTKFEGFKDFTMMTAKSGLNFGEKCAFWFYNKLRTLSKKWFTHLFLILCLVLYSVMGAAIFMALEGPMEKQITLNITDVRRDIAVKIETISRHDNKSQTSIIESIEGLLQVYASNYTDCSKTPTCNDTTLHKKTWGFMNAMFYAGTIYTTIAICFDPDEISSYWTGHLLSESGKWVMSQGNEEKKITLSLSIPIPIIKAESETQTVGQLVSRSPETVQTPIIMEPDTEPRFSLRKRRNLSKNRGQARQREKTPEPGRAPVHEDTTTSDDEEHAPQKNYREVEADCTYEEMKRLVQQQANEKDPVYDINTDEIMEQRAFAANERRRRSVSPFALPEKEREELCRLERKGSFTDPNNKLLSTNYTLSPKDEDTGRRNSLTITPPNEIMRRGSLSPPISASPIEKNMPFPLPLTPKKLEEMVYPDEVKEKTRTPVTKAEVFTFDPRDAKDTNTVTSAPSTISPKPETTKPITSKSTEATTKVTKSLESPTAAPGEIVTKVIQVERTPSKKLSQDNKPVVEVREWIVRSRKMSADIKPVLTKDKTKVSKDEPPGKVLPPVKPARSKSATRIGSKTSESEMSEDQAAGAKKKVMPTPRRFLRNRSPRAKRSQSVARVEDIKVVDKSGTAMSQTGIEIIELMQARARSLSISKDDPRLPQEYRNYSKKLQTPNRTPSVSRTSRGISCPKTIQIISDKEILSGISPAQAKQVVPPKKVEREKHRNRNSYLDASQSEHTSSCYSSSPSENEHEFDLSERTAELTRKLKMLSQEAEKREKDISNGKISREDVQKAIEETTGLRKRIVAQNNKDLKGKETAVKDKRQSLEEKHLKKGDDKKKPARSRWKIIATWQQFKLERKKDYDAMIMQRNKCVCDLLILIIICGLGGMSFRALEGSFENAYKCSTRNVKRDFIENLWRGSHYLREEDWKSMARKKLYEFEDQLHTAHEAGVTSYSGQRSWNFMNSFVYCLTLITTIGYGHIAPKTVYGRVATIIYAIVGIPLFLIVLADFGKLFTRIIKFFWAYIRRFYYTRSCRKVRGTVPVQEVMKGLNIVYDVVRRPSQIFNEEDMQVGEGLKPPHIERKPSDVPPPLPPKPGTVLEFDDETDLDTPAPTFEIDDEFNLPISVAIVIFILYIIIGAVVYSFWESWTFFESFYFVFISMSTIGLGDLVPDHPIFMMCSILYLVFGLALTSMCINVVQVKLSDTFSKARDKLGATIGLKAEEDGGLVPITPIEDVPVHKPTKKIQDKDGDNGDTKTNDDTKNR